MDTSTFLYVIFIYLQMYNPNHIMKKVKLLLLIFVSVCSIVMKGQQKEAATNESSSTQPMPYPADSTLCLYGTLQQSLPMLNLTNKHCASSINCRTAKGLLMMCVQPVPIASTH